MRGDSTETEDACVPAGGAFGPAIPAARARWHDERRILALRAARIVRALGACRSIGTRGDTYAILGFRLPAPRRLGGGHAVLIRLRDRGVSRLGVHGRFRAVAVLHGSYTTRILFGRSNGSSIRVDRDGLLAIAANGFTVK